MECLSLYREDGILVPQCLFSALKSCNFIYPVLLLSIGYIIFSSFHINGALWNFFFLANFIYRFSSLGLMFFLLLCSLPFFFVDGCVCKL